LAKILPQQAGVIATQGGQAIDASADEWVEITDVVCADCQEAVGIAVAPAAQGS